jgi:hypothetical protein
MTFGVGGTPGTWYEWVIRHPVSGGRQLAETASLDPEELHDPPQARDDLGVDLIGGNVDEAG